MTEDEFLTLTLPDRIKWLHGPQGPRGKMSHDVFARAIGTSRQVVIGWEKGTQPSPEFQVRLAQFSGFREEAFSRREAEEIAAESIGHLLGQLVESVDHQTRETSRAIGRLARAIERLERRLDDGAPRRSAAGGQG